MTNKISWYRLKIREDEILKTNTTYPFYAFCLYKIIIPHDKTTTFLRVKMFKISLLLILHCHWIIQLITSIQVEKDDWFEAVLKLSAKSIRLIIITNLTLQFEKKIQNSLYIIKIDKSNIIFSVSTHKFKLKSDQTNRLLKGIEKFNWICYIFLQVFPSGWYRFKFFFFIEIECWTVLCEHGLI